MHKLQTTVTGTRSTNGHRPEREAAIDAQLGLPATLSATMVPSITTTTDGYVLAVYLPKLLNESLQVCFPSCHLQAYIDNHAKTSWMP